MYNVVQHVSASRWVTWLVPIRGRNCLPIASTCFHLRCLVRSVFLSEYLFSPPVVGAVRVPHRFSCLCCVVLCFLFCLFFVFEPCTVYPMLQVSLDFPFLTAPVDFSDVYCNACSPYVHCNTCKKFDPCPYTSL